MAEPLSPTDPLYSPSAPLVDENPYVSAEYSGTLTQASSITTVPTHSANAKLSWSTKVSGPVDQIEYPAIYGESAIHWEVSELAGTVTVTDEQAKPQSCTGSFSATSKDGGTRGIELPLDEPGFPAGGGNPTTNPDYRVQPPQGIPLVLLASSAGTSGECGTSAWNSSQAWFGAALAQPGWEGGAGPVVYFPPGAPFTHQIDPPAYECACGAGQTFKVTLTSTLKFTSPVLPGGSAPTGGPSSGTGPSRGPGPGAPAPPLQCGPGSKVSCESKKAAQEDIRRELHPATFECELAAVGVAGIVAALAAPEVSAAAFLAAEGVVGGEVGALAGTTCGVPKQARHAGRLRTQLAVQYAAQRRAGLAISRLLEGEHFRSSISATQTQAGLADVLSKLGGHGISAAGLAKVAATTLPEGPMSAEAGFAG